MRLTIRFSYSTLEKKFMFRFQQIRPEKTLMHRTLVKLYKSYCNMIRLGK